MVTVPQVVIDYHARGYPLVCDIPVQPWVCQFWQLSDIPELNRDYQVPELAPGFVGFATSGGGEMFALTQNGSVVCLPFIGMAPKEALTIATSWAEFTRLLQAAV
jgi:hypothetical protein